MRNGIHPKYYPNAKVTCSCGASWTTGSTVEVLRTDVCSSCHPFFTGEQRIIDAAGQVDRYQKRMQRQTRYQAEEKARTEMAARKAENSVLNQQIEALDVSDRVLKALSNADVVRIGDLLAKMEQGDAEVLALEGVGPKALEEIKGQLMEFGLLPEIE